MKKLTSILIALYLIAGCSSGGGVSGGAGGAGTFTTDSGLVLAASLTPIGGISVDAFVTICDVDMDTGEATVETGITTKLGTFTVTVVDATDLTGGLFPRGITLDSYTVEFAGQRPGAPFLTPRTFAETFSILSGNGTASATVVLMDLDTIDREFQMQSSGSIVSYVVTVTFRGRDLNGEFLQIVASTFLELGDFDRCDTN